MQVEVKLFFILLVLGNINLLCNTICTVTLNLEVFIFVGGSYRTSPCLSSSSQWQRVSKLVFSTTV